MFCCWNLYSTTLFSSYSSTVFIHMDNKHRVSPQKNTKVTVRKDLFGANKTQTNDSQNSVLTENEKSALESIWGESNSSTLTQPTSNSLLFSPALKKSPNRFSTSPRLSKSPGTPRKKVSTPRKLSKYSPFRKKVYNPNPNESIKKFFSVKEHNPCQDECSQISQTSLGIVSLDNSSPSTSYGNSIAPGNCQINNITSIISEEKHSVKHASCSPSTEVSTNEIHMKIAPNITPKKGSQHNTPVKSNGSTPQSAKKALSPTSKITGLKDVYASFLLRVLLETAVYDSNPDGVKLFSEEEYAHINAFNKFDVPSQRLYARLLNRTLDWKRTATMKYGDVTLQLLLLEQNGFITSDCSNENSETLLNLLTLPDLKQLCKSYKLPETGVKNDLISRLISRAKQRSIKSFFSQATSDDCSGESNLRSKIYDLLGLVIKVVPGPHRTFSRCLLFFSYPHFMGLERDRFSDQLALVSQLRSLTFPSYDIIRTKVFESRQHFLTYEAALLESSELLEAKEDKKWELALQKLREIVKKLKCYLTGKTITDIEEMPDFLRKFTAGGCYVRAVSSSIDVLKKWNHTISEAEDCLKLLLEQRLFSRHRRGQWFEQLALLYQYNLKDNVKASQIVLRGLRDEYIDIISRHTLCARATMLEGRKKNGLIDYLRDELAKQRELVEALDEPPSITITEQVLNSFRKGLKQVYIQDLGDGKMLSSVEEVAREHFQQQGFTHGGHDEGGIIKSVVFACFWNEIYGETMVDGHGVFHSEYQTIPLDWNSETFYDRRREKLKKKLQDLAEGGIDAVIRSFKECYVNNVNTEGVVNWNYLENYNIIERFLRCIGIDVFLNLSRLLLRHHRIYKAGFPDLTLWDPIKNKCVFVEVKSPNDTLSMKQRVWLHSLNKMGTTALVCHVQSVGCKSKKRKTSPTKA